MKKSQIAVLIVLAVLYLVVLCGLGFAVYSTTTRTPDQPQAATLPTPSLTPSPPPTPTEETYNPVFEPGECPFDPPADVTVECGYVIVPEARAGDLDDTIRLAVAVYHSASDNPAPDPVIYLTGGPGGQDVAQSDYYYDKFAAQILNRDIIFFDQRGTGLSEPMLDCPEIKELYLQNQMHAIPASEREPRYTETLMACRDRLVSEGANLAAYTSTASAADVNDIAGALGYERLNLYGISYGTRLALTVMRDFPTLVRSAVLDSVLPVEARSYLEGDDTIEQALNVLFAGCAADPKCHAAYPDLETVFYELVEQLNSAPVTVEALSETRPYTTTVDGIEFKSAIVWGLYVSSLIPIVPQAIYDVRDGDYTMLGYTMSLPAWAYEDISLGMMASVNCHEQVFTITPEEIDASLAQSHQTASVGLNDVYGSGQELFSICEQWGAAPFDPLDDQPVVSDIPALIISGEYDPTTPPSYGQQAAANLSHSHMFEIPGQGHAPSVGEASECVLSIVAAFLDAPTGDPYRTCIANLESPQFVVPSESATGEEITFEPFVNQEYEIKGIVPSGWMDVGLSFYNRHTHPLDIVQIGMQTSLADKEEWLDWLSTQFQRVGLDGAPQFAGEREANGFIWTLYTAAYKGNPVDLALADADDTTMLVVLLSNNDEHAALYERVFVPVVDALLPLE